MRRREFIAGLGGVVGWSIAARTEERERIRRVGVLMNSTATDADFQSYLALFVQGLSQLGGPKAKICDSTFAGARAISSSHGPMRRS
jgi:hypothetical protein